MTVLSRAAVSPAAPASSITLQCDVCLPPRVATNPVAWLREAGWALTDDGARLDVCPICSRRLPSREHTRHGADGFRSLPATSGSWPDLVVIGAAKCATTSLHAYLDAHPDVSMSVVKEPQFFQDPHREDWGDQYRGLFDPAARVSGESSTLYSRAPAVPGVAANLAATIPDVRLIYLVRDPVDRALAAYAEERTHGFESRPMEEAFADLDDPYEPHLAASRYAEQLQHYLRHFDPAQLLVVDMHDLAQAPEATMTRIFGFLEVDPRRAVGTGSGFSERLNPRADKVEYSPAVRRLRGSAALRLAYRLPPRLREGLLAPLRSALARPIELPPVDELRAQLERHLAADAALLRTLTGQAFEHWSV